MALHLLASAPIWALQASAAAGNSQAVARRIQRVVAFTLDIFNVDYDELLTDTAKLAAVRRRIGLAVASEAGEEVTVDNVETVLSPGPSAEAAGASSIRADVSVSPPSGVSPEQIRDTLANSSLLGQLVVDGIDMVDDVFGMQAAGSDSVKVVPVAVPVVKDGSQGLPITVVLSIASGVLLVLAALLWLGRCACQKVRSAWLSGREEEEKAKGVERPRRGNVLHCCGAGSRAGSTYQRVSSAD